MIPLVKVFKERSEVPSDLYPTTGFVEMRSDTHLVLQLDSRTDESFAIERTTDIPEFMAKNGSGNEFKAWATLSEPTTNFWIGDFEKIEDRDPEEVAREFEELTSPADTIWI
jgi:hypothetical protein